MDSMQKYMSCKGACLASIGTDQPAEVVEDAPRHLVYFPFLTKLYQFTTRENLQYLLSGLLQHLLLKSLLTNWQFTNGIRTGGGGKILDQFA